MLPCPPHRLVGCCWLMHNPIASWKHCTPTNSAVCDVCMRKCPPGTAVVDGPRAAAPSTHTDTHTPVCCAAVANQVRGSAYKPCGMRATMHTPLSPLVPPAHSNASSRQRPRHCRSSPVVQACLDVHTNIFPTDNRRPTERHQQRLHHTTQQSGLQWHAFAANQPGQTAAMSAEAHIESLAAAGMLAATPATTSPLITMQHGGCFFDAVVNAVSDPHALDSRAACAGKVRAHFNLNGPTDKS